MIEPLKDQLQNEEIIKQLNQIKEMIAEINKLLGSIEINLNDTTLETIKKNYEWFRTTLISDQREEMKEYENFDSRTGKKQNPTCQYCWVLKEENHNCGYEKCPGYELPRLLKLKTE